MRPGYPIDVAEVAVGPRLYVVGDGDMLKIGRTDNVPKRFANLQTSNPRVLEIWAIGCDPERESEIHEACGSWRVRGEWFRDTVEIWAVLRTFGLEIVDAHCEECGETSYEIADGIWYCEMCGHEDYDRGAA